MAKYNVAIQNEAFSPPLVTVHAGDNVVWTNMDPLLYELYFQYGKGGTALSPFLQQGQTFTLSFSSCDTITYVTVSSPVTITGTINVRIQGDVNGDGRVDITDLVLVGSHFGSTTGSATFYPPADLDQDGLIDIVDLVLVASHFGSTCV